MECFRHPLNPLAWNQKCVRVCVSLDGQVYLIELLGVGPKNEIDEVFTNRREVVAGARLNRFDEVTVFAPQRTRQRSGQ